MCDKVGVPACIPWQGAEGSRKGEAQAMTEIPEC
jgi:hypothetical protein